MWIIIISWCSGITFIMILVLCICWRKKTVTEDWHGLDGMVTQKNPDENVNHLPSATNCIVDSSTETSNLSKRNLTNSRRSLPDIPSEQATNVTWDPTDNSSEHYATVGQFTLGKRHTIANGVDQRPSISQHSSISQNDDNFSPYEKVKYDKIKSKEHPYAQLQPIENEENHSNSEEGINLLLETNLVEENSSPIRSRRSSLNSVGLDIPAASAVAGVVAASPELPYMTPPVTQANFSGDSQDSSKGYTSISVREPLANILAQTKETKVYPHYSTVSDDSDDVYTTIPDPNNPIYQTESETYARIPPLPITVEVEVNPPPPVHLQIQQTVLEDDNHGVVPRPPPVDSLKQVMAQNQSKSRSHSRQGSSSSSSIANLGSPKPEKRQANSPLPPPPAVSNFDFHEDKLQILRNLDDLYAKVHKNKKEETCIERIDIQSVAIVNNITRSSLPQRRYKNHNYETLKTSSTRRISDPGYEKIRGNTEEPGYASINGPESITNSDAGYEVLKHKFFRESDPNYEELRHRTSNASDCSAYTKIKDLNDGYSIVKKNNIESDPNYETVKDMKKEKEEEEEEEPPYEKLDSDTSKKKEYEKTDTSESSSSLGKSLSEKEDLPYEMLNNDIDSDLSGYEKIGTKSGNLVVRSTTNHDTTNIHDEDGIFEV